MTAQYWAVVMIILTLLLVMSGLPLAFILMFLGVIFGMVYMGTPVFPMFVNRLWGSVMTEEIFIAVPLFVFMGCILEKSGAAERLFNALYQLFGRMRGGLALTTIIICTVFAACTGVIAASVVTMTLVALPAMLKRGYSKPLATGVICAGGVLGILIPPSVMLVVYGPMANISVAKLFAAAFVPGFILSGLFLLYTIIVCWLRPQMGPAIPDEEKRASAAKLLGETAKYALPIIALIVLVLGSILGGIASPTEASGIGAFGALLLAAGYRTLNLRNVRDAAYESLKITSMVFFVIAGASMFTGVFLAMKGSELVAGALLGLPFGKWFVLAMMMFIIFIMGMFLDWIGILFVIVPAFLPVASALGFDPLWFALLICVNLQMAFLTPPFAGAIFFLKGVAPPEISTADIYKGVVPFVILQATGLVLCILFPQLVLWLPSITLGK